MKFEEMYDVLKWEICVSQEALDLVFALNGCNEKAACDILFYYTGWNNFEGFLEELHGENE